VDKQREALMSEVGAATPEATAALVELRRSLEAVERMLPVLGPLLDTAGESEPLDMAEVRSLAQDAAGVASEFKSLADSLHAIITDLPQATAVLEELSAAQRSITNYAVGALLVLIAAFFVMLLAYRLVAARLLRR
jgi:phage-related tail protein